jgi:predicted component of type VI protein secretion system
MVQLNILSGSSAGGSQVVRRFPFHVGRGPGNDLRLDGAGIWDHHFTLSLRRNEGFMLQTIDQALASVNNEPASSVRLRNGDVISVGSVKVQFWLSTPAQRGLRLHEWATWVLLLLVTLGQLALISWLLRLG